MTSGTAERAPCPNELGTTRPKCDDQRGGGRDAEDQEIRTRSDRQREPHAHPERAAVGRRAEQAQHRKRPGGCHRHAGGDGDLVRAHARQHEWNGVAEAEDQGPEEERDAQALSAAERLANEHQGGDESPGAEQRRDQLIRRGAVRQELHRDVAEQHRQRRVVEIVVAVEVAGIPGIKKVALPAFEWIRNGNADERSLKGIGLESGRSLVFPTGCPHCSGSGAEAVGNAWRAVGGSVFQALWKDAEVGWVRLSAVQQSPRPCA